MRDKIVEQLKAIIEKEVKPMYQDVAVVRMLNWLMRIDKHKTMHNFLMMVTEQEITLGSNLGNIKDHLLVYGNQPVKFFLFALNQSEVQELSRQEVLDRLEYSAKIHGLNCYCTNSMPLL